MLPPLAAPLPDRPVTRFAPSPTGYLHLGHLVNAIYTWGVARALGGTVVLRIEDHDRGRFRPEYERGILDDLEWLGFVPDVGAIAEYRRGPSPFRQSDRAARYQAAVAELGTRVYACDCTRRVIAAASDGEGELRYPGTCRDRGLDAGPHRGLRLRLGDGPESFVDALAGPQVQSPVEQCGDVLVRDRHGNWTYQFAVTVDDLDQGITLVIRGVDLLESTGRQLAMARLLGRREPVAVLHHPLILDAGGRKLAKRDGDTGVRELRAAGLRPGDVIGRAAQAVGLVERTRSIQAPDVSGLFEDWLR